MRLTGMPALRERCAKILAATENLEPALLRAGVAALKAAEDRIDAGGPGWPANQTGTPLLHRTGRLLGSLSVGGSSNDLTLSGNTIIVGTGVEYAPYLQFGTRARSVSGQRESRIAGMLGGGNVVSWLRGGGGIPPRPYLFFDDQLVEVIEKIFASHLMGTTDFSGGPPG